MMLRVFNYNTLEKVIIQSEKKTEYRENMIACWYMYIKNYIV